MGDDRERVAAASSMGSAEMETSAEGYLANKYDILGVLGFSIYLAWIFLIIADVLQVNKLAGSSHGFGIVPFFFLGQIIAAGVLWVFSRPLSRKPAIVGVGIMIFVLVPLPGIIMLFMTTYESVLIAIWIAAGFGGHFLLALWGIFLSGLTHKTATLYPPLAVLVQSFIILAILYLLRIEIVDIAMIVLPLTSSTLFFVWWVSALGEKRIQFFNNTKPPDTLALLRSSSAMVANNFLIGFVLYSLSIAESFVVGLVIIAVVICAAILKIYDAMHYQRFEVREIIKVLAPTAALGLLLLPYISIEIRIACLGFMMLVAMLDEIVCWSAVSEYMHVYQLIPFANIAFGRLGDTVGCFLGYICALLVFGTGLGGEIASPYLLSIVVILFIFIQAFFFRDNYSPFSEHSLADGEDDCGYPTVQRTGHWKQRCERFADFHKLTPRQRDALLPFAKGYSTKAIEDILVVSSHTVKAHIYNIYRKTGVHTRQELIEAIERFDYEDPEKDMHNDTQID